MTGLDRPPHRHHRAGDGYYHRDYVGPGLPVTGSLTPFAADLDDPRHRR